MNSGFWQFIFKLSIVGNAVLFVALLGGSHAVQLGPQIYPHKPVHFSRDFNTFTAYRYTHAVYNAQQDWDDETGSNILYYYIEDGVQKYDVRLFDMAPGGSAHFLFRPHTGSNVYVDYTFEAGPQETATTTYYPLGLTGGTWALHVITVNQVLFPGRTDADNQRTITHEFGHTLGLGDHNVDYNGMMDQ